MDFIIMDDPNKIGPLKTGNICPYCGERTAIKLTSVSTKIGHIDDMRALCEYICFFCKNRKCNMCDKLFHVPKSVYNK